MYFDYFNSSDQLRHLPNLSVISVRLLEDTFHTKQGVHVRLVDGNEDQDDDLEATSSEGRIKSSEPTGNSESSEMDERKEDEDFPAAAMEEEAEHDDVDEGFDWNYDAQPNLTLLAKSMLCYGFPQIHFGIYLFEHVY